MEMISCYEAGYDGFWLHRLLERQGVRSHVIDPANVQMDRRARRAKTDHIDAELLLRSLMAYLRDEPKVWSVLRVPSVAEEDDRRLRRERDRLIAERGQHVNRIKGLCAIHGIYDYEPMRRDRMLRLEQLHSGDGRELPPRLKALIARELQRLELILGMRGNCARHAQDRGSTKAANSPTMAATFKTQPRRARAPDRVGSEQCGSPIFLCWSAVAGR
jgi:transposase